MRRFEPCKPRWTWSVASAVALIAASTVGCQGPSDEAGGPADCRGDFDEAGVRSAFERQRAAWNRGDLDGFLSGYERSDEFVFTSGAKIRRGYDELATGFRDRYGDAPDTMGQLSFDLVDIRALGSCRDVAVVLGRWALTEGQADGSGVFSVVLERRDAEWRIVHDHTSSDPPPTDAVQ